MSVLEALRVLRENYPIPSTNRNDNLSPEQVAIRDAFRVLEAVALQSQAGKHYD